MMARIGYERWGSRLVGTVVIAFLFMASVHVSARQGASSNKVTEEVEQPHYVMKVSKPAAPRGHVHVWPVIDMHVC
jgi:hypothetical protein